MVDDELMRREPPVSDVGVLRLSGVDGSLLKVDIAGFELSNFRHGYPPQVLLYWPILWIEASAEGDCWSADCSVGPSEELEDLAAWLEGLAGESCADRVFSFSEPFLSFEGKENGPGRRIVLVHLQGELGPELDDGTRVSRSLRFDLEWGQLLKAAQSAREMASKEPPAQWRTMSRRWR